MIEPTIMRPAGVLLQREVRTVLVVIANIRGHQPFQMPFVEHDDMILDRKGLDR
jgi:hypothetical protein